MRIILLKVKQFNIQVVEEVFRINFTRTAQGIAPVKVQTSFNIFHRAFIEELSSVQQGDSVNQAFQVEPPCGKK